MRLLFVCHSFPPANEPLANVGGMQRAAIELHDALQAHPRVALHPLILRSAWEERHTRVPRFLVESLGRIARLVARGEVDAVLFSSLVTATLAIPLRRRLARGGVASAAIAYGLDVTTPVRPWQWAVRRTFGALDAVLPISTATARACTARGLPPTRQVVVPLGVDLGRCTPPTDRSAARAELLGAFPGGAGGAHALPNDALLLCSVGRQVRRKGFHWFLTQVMPRLPAGVHYWLAGEGPEGPRLCDAVERLGLAGRVRLLGSVTDAELMRLYRGADLFVMPNVPVSGDMEGFGLVLLEAGACGLPSIASRLEGITDVITEGANGELVESGDAAAFARAIERYYRDRGALAAAGTRAARHTARTFGWAGAADRYVSALSAMVDRFAAGGGRCDTSLREGWQNG